MTAEVAILNKSAVALATDSAVTIGGGSPDVRKIYVDANKLFELVKGRPVGVMIYDSADISGVPWETIVKLYRERRCHVRFDHLHEYAEDLQSFIRTDVSPMIAESAKDSRFNIIIYNACLIIWTRGVDPLLPDDLNKRSASKQIQDILDKIYEEFSERDIQDWARGLDEQSLLRERQDVVADLLPPEIESTKLTKATKRRLVKTAIHFVLRSESLFGPTTGLVVAGFGECEIFPSIYHVNVHGMARDHLVTLGEEIDEISDDRPSIIEPYAQTGEARLFLSGIDPEASQAVISYWSKWSGGIIDAVMSILQKSVESLGDDEASRVADGLRSFMDSSWSEFSDYMNKQFHERRFEPIEASAAFLSKQEMAHLAESLIDLASLRDRVSLDRQETVAGATDVAVISRGDGFVWIKRKHYFDLDYNPTWPTRQLAANQGARTESGGQGS